MTDTEQDALPDFRRLPVPEALAWLAEHGEPADPRPDIDTASLVRRFPHLGSVVMRDLEIAGPHGPVPVRTYRDASATPTGTGLVWVHGGAFIGGHLDMPESNWVALELAARGIPVIAVDYRKCLAGVHHPVPSDDVIAAWSFARANSAELIGVAPERLALGGASAGGALTAGATTRLRDAAAPLPERLVLVYPVLHPNGPAASAEVDPESPHGQLTLNYAGSPEALADPHAFAGLGDGHGFPETLIFVCERDDLRPSGEAFAQQLEHVGVPVSLYLEPGAEHGHINEPADPTALPTIDAIADWLRAP
ncbi:alpha/beta hydrolase [Microbacterium hominis]|uniref:Alpha/beta hydrolase n=1 Tax=Microbacterium hominis TaxID=162426 RepID=A0A7D4TGT5_9MICO|nr:alpha/beta hydrolase [Microbacterium hominis]QKJ20420.1 alpha/beta hydrolase [Microbacterium hominis]